MTRYTAPALLLLADAIDAEEANIEEAALMNAKIVFAGPDLVHLESEIVLLAEAIRSLDD